jgi:3-oxoacyl-[acyl-carrier protein] reductase
VNALKSKPAKRTNKKDGRLRDRIAIVTGGSRGIGRAIAIALGSEGANVVVCARSEAGVQDVCGSIERLGVHAMGATGDVTDPAFANDTVRRTVERFGRVDLLVNNVGGTQPAPFQSLEDYDYDTWWKILDLNLTSHFSFLPAVIPEMVNQRFGRIVAISSLAGVSGAPFNWSPPYCAAKSAVIGLIKQVGLEFGPYGVRANVVVPSDVETERMEELGEESAYPETAAQMRERYLSEPLGRPGRAEEIAAAVVFLLSEESSYITAETLNVVGGSYVAP